MLSQEDSGKITSTPQLYIDVSEFVNQSFRQKQLNEAIFKHGADSWSEISTFSLDLRNRLEAEIPFHTITVDQSFISREQQVNKVLFRTKDNLLFESVLLRHHKERNTVCVSTQIGCSMGCKFCATGKMGLLRNLTYREIVEQVLYFSNLVKKEDDVITNVVFMGMGEPFLNETNVELSVDILTDPEQMGLSSRRLTMSSVGIPEPMKVFFQKHPQVNLAISLHSAIQGVREELMPVASKTHLDDIAQYVDWHVTSNNRRVSFEYLMLKDINDTDEALDALIQYVKSTTARWSKLVHVNLIPLNKIEDSIYTPSDRATIEDFQEVLQNEGINVTIRKSLGSEEEAACGMLRVKALS